jgi:uncharacterized SAM-binding protein YcdF (DUF218 family)
MFTLKKIAAALVLPPAGLILLALGGLWLSRRHPRAGRSIAFLALVALFALSLPPVADALMAGLELPPITEADLKRADAIVILGAGTYHDAPEYGGDSLRGAALVRLRYGAALQRRTKLPILVTGGSPFGGRPEGELMKEVLERDFQASVQWIESASRDTAENARFSAPMLKSGNVSRIVLVSHVWHLRRATPLFRAQGLEVFPAGTSYATPAPAALASLLPSAVALEASCRALLEWTAIAVQSAGALR